MSNGTAILKLVPHDTRDEVVDYVKHWTERTELPKTKLVGWLGVGTSKFYQWQDRYGHANEHNGQIPRDLPFARREAVTALKVSYDSNDAAMAGIDARLREAYRPQAGTSAAALARTIAGVQAVYARNIFPAMKVTWGTYPNNIGHVAFQGCFRCHDDNHKATDGTAIKQDCESCHAMP